MINTVIMNYEYIYYSLINRSQNRTLTGCREKHHIIPKCMGGTDDISNIAILTAEEHFIAHLLLIKIYPKNNKLLWAVRMMTASNKGQVRNNKEYSWVRKRIIKHLKETRTGVKTGKQRIFHMVDPYLKSFKISLYIHILPFYLYNPYKSYQDVVISSRIFLSIL